MMLGDYHWGNSVVIPYNNAEEVAMAHLKEIRTFLDAALALKKIRSHVRRLTRI